MLAPTPVTQRRTILGMDVHATPHPAFTEGQQIAARLAAVAAPLIPLGGAAFTITGKDGKREPIALQELIARAAGGNQVNAPLLLDALASLSPEAVIGALVQVVQRLFLDDPAKAESLQLMILANTSVAVATATGGMTYLQLSSREAIGQVVGTSYRRLFALLAFQLEVSFGDFFGGGSRGGLAATAQP